MFLLVIESPSCSLSQFEPFAAPAIELLFEIEKSSSGGDAYIQILFVLSKVIEKLGKKVSYTLWCKTRRKERCEASTTNEMIYSDNSKPLLLV